MRDKKRDRARDEDLEEDIRPKQNSTDLPFMTVEEASFAVSLLSSTQLTLEAGPFSFMGLEVGGIMACRKVVAQGWGIVEFFFVPF